MSKIEGNCLCGELTYSSDAEPQMIAMCHCKDCQRQSGSPFSVNVLIPVEELDIRGESLTKYVINGDSGKRVTRNFCNKCGSPISTELEAFGGLAAVKAGTINDNAWVKPTVQIWCDSKQPWSIVDDEVSTVPRNPG